MMLRRIARPMLAAWFVTEGAAAVRGAPAHLEPARAGVDALAEPLGFTRPDDAQLRTIVQVHGGLTIAAGAALALGKAPRLAAVLLAALTFPSVVASLVASRRATTTPATKADLQQRAVRALSFTGAALIAAADREGRPGLRWKLSHAKQLAAAGAATGVAGLGKGGATSKAAETKGAEEAGAKAAKRAKKVEKAAAAATAGAASAADPGDGSAAGSATPKRSELRAQRKAVEATRRADARAAKVAAAQAAEAEKAARVAERAEAKTAKVTRRALRAEVKAAKRAAKDVEDVVAA